MQTKARQNGDRRSEGRGRHSSRGVVAAQCGAIERVQIETGALPAQSRQAEEGRRNRGGDRQCATEQTSQSVAGQTRTDSDRVSRHYRPRARFDCIWSSASRATLGQKGRSSCQAQRASGRSEKERQAQEEVNLFK